MPATVYSEAGLASSWRCTWLRRFNGSLGQAGIRAELDTNGELRLSPREGDWQRLKDQLAVQGEGKLFEKGRYVRVQS